MKSLRDIGRASGVILHPTSLPGPHGIGDLGPAAYRWVDVLAESGTGLWQVLPLGPTGYGDSPYQSFSAFAGNVNLISPDLLVDDGLLDGSAPPRFPADRVAYGSVIAWKRSLLADAFTAFSNGAGSDEMHSGYARFVREHPWLDDFALFTAIKDDRGGGSWHGWPDDLRMRDAMALERARRDLGHEIERVRFEQFLFARQWRALHAYASKRCVRIVGDVPFFVASDSADVWSHPELFLLDERRRPAVVAGVPPDYFSASGQLWGNPIYDWEEHRRTGYRWWADRLAATFGDTDIARIDHFRAFADYWEIPAGADTAVHGAWREGPGAVFFDAMSERFGSLPIIAEDLGDLSDRVPALLDRVGFPGMRVLAFAFSDDETNDHLPHRYPFNSVAYTGTHDNDTTLGWWRSATEHERAFAARYLSVDPQDPVRAFLEAVWSSRSRFAIAPTQDLLRLGPEARMNTPGTTDGNWGWRLSPDDLAGDRIRSELRSLNDAYDRVSGSRIR
jgi:4-alpha-glucanotransferase